MYKKILLPLDGSALSENAAEHCISFAAASGAEIVGFHVMRPYSVFTSGALAGQQMLASIPEETFEANARAQAGKYLDVVRERAAAGGVECRCACTFHEHPYEAIIDAAREHGCDLIFMASHGRSGLEGMLLGSETQKVLIHCRVPVLVYR